MTAWCFTRTDLVERELAYVDIGSAQTIAVSRVKRTSVTISAPSWYDAREHARAMLRMDELPIEKPGVPVPPPPSLSWRDADDSDATVVIEWEGHDFGHVPTRRKVIRAVEPHKLNGKTNGAGR